MIYLALQADEADYLARILSDETERVSDEPNYSSRDEARLIDIRAKLDDALRA